jgi:hypothetical protein
MSRAYLFKYYITINFINHDSIIKNISTSKLKINHRYAFVCGFFFVLGNWIMLYKSWSWYSTWKEKKKWKRVERGQWLEVLLSEYPPNHKSKTSRSSVHVSNFLTNHPTNPFSWVQIIGLHEIPGFSTPKLGQSWTWCNCSWKIF